MSLDAAEFFMDLEDRLRIHVPERDAAELVTMGQLTDYLSRRMSAIRGAWPCRSMLTFFKLRRVLRELLGDRELRLRPGTPLADVVPRQDRPAVWQALRRRFGEVEQWPTLVRPAWVYRTIATLCIVAVGAGFLGAGPLVSCSGGLLLGSGIAVALSCVLYAVSAPLALEFEAGCGTAGELTRFLLAYEPLPTDGTPATREYVAAVVRDLIRTKFKVAEFTDDTTWEELGVD